MGVGVELVVTLPRDVASVPLGLILMGALMDQLAFEAVEPHGTALRLVKRLAFFNEPPLGQSRATVP